MVISLTWRIGPVIPSPGGHAVRKGVYFVGIEGDGHGLISIYGKGSYMGIPGIFIVTFGLCVRTRDAPPGRVMYCADLPRLYTGQW